jgi:hypothetical protein
MVGDRFPALPMRGTLRHTELVLAVLAAIGAAGDDKVEDDPYHK